MKRLYLIIIIISLFSFSNTILSQISYITTCSAQDSWPSTYFGLTSVHSCSGSSLYDNLWSSVSTANTYRNVGTSNGNLATITFDFKAKNYSKIKLLNEKIDEMNSNREKIVIRNRGLVMRDEDLKQITIIDSEIDELKQSLKVLKVKTK